MLAGALITIRESLEAFLVIGILLGYVTQLGQPRVRKFIWLGAAAAVVVSAVVAVVFQWLAIEFEGTAEELFAAIVAFSAAAVLTWMLLWMQRQSRSLEGELERQARAALSGGQAFALAGLAFISVLREGLETALFLGAMFVVAREDNPLPGAALGLAIAAVLIYLIFRSTVRLNLRAFFITTGTLLILVAAGLCASAVLELQQAGVLTFLAHPAWDLSALLSNESVPGAVLHALFGYDAAPSWLMVAVYCAYLLVFGTGFLRAVRSTSAPRRALRA